VTRPLSPVLLRAVFGILLLSLAAEPAPAGPRAPRTPPRLVLLTTTAQERTVEAEDLTFAFFRRVFYTKTAPRHQSPTRQRIEVQDRREECKCLRLSDWSKIKFKKLRQITIDYPDGSRQARLRLTYRDGRVNELPASALHGATDPFPPRFGATIDGLYREFPLVVEDSLAIGWPDETLSRILLVTSTPPRKKRSRRR
jgi:hypothetical protein